MKYHVILSKQNGDVIDQGDFDDRAEVGRWVGRWAVGRTKDYPAGEPRTCYIVRIYEGEDLIAKYVEI